ncbi:MAG: MobF family relaxase [Acidimicrobiales bacterium]
MRLTVTPIGGVARSAGAVARAVVDYLDGRRGDPAVGLLASGMVAYLADSKEGPGRWLGTGAAFHGLAGVVEREAFQRVLEGRHPVTGARLITAQGSSQRSHLAVGNAARFDADGQPLYGVADAAALLGRRVGDIEAMIQADRGAEPDDDWIATVAIDGTTYIPDGEIARHLDLAARPISVDAIRVGGDPDELLTVTQVARLLKVTPRYVRRLCERGEQPPPPGWADDGERPRPASLPARRIHHRGKWSYRIRRGDVANFAAIRQPPVARVGYDCTLTVEKSVSILALLSTGPRQQRLIAALDVANRTAIDHLDQVAAVARRGRDVVYSEGLLAATFVHGTSRSLDPHWHHHNIVANTVVDDRGDVRALDARALYRHAPAAAALATAALRWELRDLGLGWRRRGDGIWEIAGCSDALIAEFSQRHHEIAEIRNAVAAELGRRITDGEDHTIWAATRPDKQTVEPAALLADWRHRAARHGFDVEVCFHQLEPAAAVERLPGVHLDRLLADLAAPETGVCSNHGDFTHADVVRAIADWSLPPTAEGKARRKVLLPPDEIVRLADVFCASDLVVPIDPTCRGSVIRRRDCVVIDDGQHELHYITAELLDAQVFALDAWTRGRNSGVAVVDDHHLALAVAAEPQLSDEQAQLVRRWCTSGDVVQAAVGRAGTGKTTTMRVAADAWRRAGFRVLGAAVKAEAARLLAAEAGLETDTVARLLARARRGDVDLDARSMLIVDEASTVGDRDLAALIRLAQRSGSAVRFLGDPAQHSAVPAAGCFEYLAGDPDVAKLETIHRLVDVGERHRAELVRDGRARRAIAEMEAAGQLVLRPSEAETYAAVLARWYRARRNGMPHPIVHGRNQQRRELNQLAQQLLVADGEVDPERAVQRSDGRRLCVGDEVIARHGDRTIHPPGNRAAWLRNGTTGRIIAVEFGVTADDDAIQLQTVGGAVLTCPRDVFDRAGGGIDLSYAVTSYAVQGSTRDISTSVATSTTTRKELYVDITRGRRQNLVFGTEDAPPGDTAEQLPTVPQPLVDDLTVGLAKRTPPPVAVDDSNAPAVIATRRGRSLAALLAAHRNGEHGALPATIERVAATIRQTGEHQLAISPSAGRVVMTLDGTAVPTRWVGCC